MFDAASRLPFRLRLEARPLSLQGFVAENDGAAAIVGEENAVTVTRTNARNESKICFPSVPSARHRVAAEVVASGG
jgi:hypothetical protein